jgi:hypothetical protein
MTATPDPSDAMPTGGYLGPLLPPAWLRSGLLAGTIFGVLDRYFDGLRLLVGTQTKALFRIDSAQGGWLDALGAWVGIIRRTGEDDTSYHVRIPATIAHGPRATTAPHLSEFIVAITGVPAVVETGPPGTSSYTVTVVGNPPQLGWIVDIVRSLKPIGAVFTVAAVVPSAGGTGRLGETRLGETRLGGENGIVVIGSSATP